MAYIKKLPLKTKLLIYEIKERFPQLSAEFIADRFSLDLAAIELLFNEGEIEIPSKMNKEHGQRGKKIYRRERLLLRERESTLHEGIPGKKRPMLRRTV
jgi:hypothetical protein